MAFLDYTGLSRFKSKLDALFTKGPSSSTSNGVAIFGDTGGKTLKDSGFTIGKSVPSDAKFTDTTYSAATTSKNGLMSSDDKTKLNGIDAGAEVNQNAFSNVVVGNTTVSADSKTDTLTLVAGSNVTLTPDATNDKITIAATDTNTWRPVSDSVSSTSSSDAASSKAVKTAYDLANGKASTSVATQSANGLMSSTDKTKLDGIATGATANVGTITGIKMNGASKGTSGVVNLGTVLTSHQDISNKANCDEIGIVVTGNTASQNVTSGQYVIVRNSTISGISDGFYMASANVSAGTAFTSANLTAVSNGGLNSLNEQLLKSCSPYKKRIIVIGDSYGGRVDTNNNTYFQIICSKLGLSINDAKQGYAPGAAFSHGTASSRFINILKGISIDNHDTVTDIIVQCGANDVNYSYDSNLASINEFCTYCKEEYPNALVTLFMCGLTFNKTIMYYKQTRVIDAANAASSSIYIPKFAFYLLCNTLYLETDRCHPNASGVTVIADAMIRALSKAQYEYSYMITPEVAYLTVNYENPSSTTLDYTLTCEMRRDGDEFKLYGTNNNPILRFRSNVLGAKITTSGIILGLNKVCSCGIMSPSADVQSIVYLYEENEPENNAPAAFYLDFNSDNNSYYAKIVPFEPFTCKNSNTANIKVVGSINYKGN